MVTSSLRLANRASWDEGVAFSRSRAIYDVDRWPEVGMVPCRLGGAVLGNARAVTSSTCSVASTAGMRGRPLPV